MVNLILIHYSKTEILVTAYKIDEKVDTKVVCSCPILLIFKNILAFCFVQGCLCKKYSKIVADLFKLKYIYTFYNIETYLKRLMSI